MTIAKRPATRARLEFPVVGKLSRPQRSGTVGPPNLQWLVMSAANRFGLRVDTLPRSQDCRWSFVNAESGTVRRAIAALQLRTRGR